MDKAAYLVLIVGLSDLRPSQGLRKSCSAGGRLSRPRLVDPPAAPGARRGSPHRRLPGYDLVAIGGSCYVGRPIGAHCTIHDAQPDGQALCAVLEGATQVADIRLRLASTSPPPPDCLGSKLSTKCSVVATGTVIDVGGEPGLAEATVSH